MRQVLIRTLLDVSARKPVTFITGDAGIGKTTVLHEVEGGLNANSGVACAFTDCSAPVGGVDVGSVESLHPWISAMKGLATNSQGSGGKKLAADLAMAWIKFVPIVGDVIESTVSTVNIVKKHRTVGTETPVSREHVFEQCIAFFNTVSSKQLVVVIIDDAHWADDSSVNLLFALARTNNPNLKFFVSYRPFDVKTSRNGGEHPLVHIERELNRYELCESIIVEPLTDDELKHLIGETNADASHSQFEEIKRFSKGNPLLALGWTADGEVSSTVDAVVSERIKRLDSQLKELLMYASAEGEVFTSLVLRSISQQAPLTVASLLRKAEQEHGLICAMNKSEHYATETQVYEFSNQAIHLAFEKMLGGEESEILHAAIATELAKEFDLLDKTDVRWTNTGIRLAVQFKMAGEFLRSAQTNVLLAQRSWDLYAETEAMHALDLAADAMSLARRSTGEILKVEIDVLELRAKIHQFNRRIDYAINATKQMRDLALQANNDHAAINALVRQAQLANLDGKPNEVEKYASVALEDSLKINYVDGERGATSMLGMWHESNGRVQEALAMFQRTLELARQSDSDHFQATSLVNIGRQQMHMGFAEEALNSFLKAAELLEANKVWDALARALNNAGICYVELGRMDDAFKVYSRALQLHEQIGDKIGASSLRTNLGQFQLRNSRIEEALELFEQSIKMKTELGDLYGLSIAVYSKGLALAQRNETQAALEFLKQAKAIAEQAGEQLVVEIIEKEIESVSVS